MFQHQIICSTLYGLVINLGVATKTEAAHGDSQFLPKHHFSLHLPQQLSEHKLLCACFVHERRRKIMKRPWGKVWFCFASMFRFAL